MDGYDLIVVGGGPGGSTVASAVARAGKRVLVLDRAEPRPPFGQALRPGLIPILDAIGAFEAIDAAGFTRKTGSTHWGWGRTSEWDLWFADSEVYEYAWFVDRPRFDAILHDHARASGAHVVDGAVVKRLIWEGDRLAGVAWEQDGRVTETRARFVVDASGRAHLVGRALDLYEVLPGLQHQAFFAHFEGVRGCEPPRDQQALFLAEERHWFWVFPLADGQWSIGMVLLDDPEGEDERFRVAQFDDAVAAAARLQPVLGPDARRVSPVQRRRDWSYRMKRVSGPGWFLVGDAAGFIDPVLAQGVVMAMNTGYMVARGVLAVMEGKATEEQLAARYQKEHAEHFDDLVQMLRFFYTWEVEKDDYFWESKRILARSKLRLRPQKAFAFLTSGLIRNLALTEKREAVDAKRQRAVSQAEAPSIAGEGDPESLDFVGVHLQYHHPRAPGVIYLLIEPSDRSAPTLFRSLNYDVNVMSRLYRDPLRDPLLARILGAFGQSVRAWDQLPGEPLARFWCRNRARFTELLGAFPERLEVVRVFGE